MKFIDEFRDADIAAKLADSIHHKTRQPWKIMEICGGQTHAIMKYGLEQLLPPDITLVHGPGCPVCVTPTQIIDRAIEIAAQANVIFCSFGDMLRVPGSNQDLLSIKAQGGDVRTVYSPLDALKISQQFSDKQVVFFAVGFETTAPTTAMAAYQARQLGLKNFSLLVSHVRVPPAMQVILSAPGNQVQGFLAAGHVCTVMGYQEYLAIAQQYEVPIVVTGFEPVDILQGILHCVEQLEAGRYCVDNCYNRVVKKDGNPHALEMMDHVFDTVAQTWRGLGVIENSGLALNATYADFDAALRFNSQLTVTVESTQCKSGEVLQGLLNPDQCPAFGKACTPEHPLGATMVSSEGTCAAYYRYQPHSTEIN